MTDAEIRSRVVSRLQGWVAIEAKRPGKGITPEEYEQITGEQYPNE